MACHFFFAMKKFFILCLTFILLLYFSLSSFAISRYDAYAYWASASNQFRFLGENFVDMFNYSKGSGMLPPASIQSDFYKNGYYSNNLALFSQNSTGYANESLSAYETYFDWTFSGIDGSTPSDSGLLLPGTTRYSMTNEGLEIHLNGYRYSQPAVSYSDYDVQTVLVYETTFKVNDFTHNANWNPLRFELSYENNGSYWLCSCDIGTKDGTNYYLMIPKTAEAVYWPDKASFNSARTETSLILPNTTYNFKMVVDSQNQVYYYLDDVYQGSYVAYGVGLNSSSPYNARTKFQVSADSVTFTHFSLKREVVPTATVIANLGRSITIPAGDEMEFYVRLKSGSVTNVSNSITTNFYFSDISVVTLFLNNETVVNPAIYDDGWLYVSLPASDFDRTFERCFFSFSTPYVTYSPGDQLQWDMEVAFSDLVFGELDDIGFTPDVNPDDDQFRDEVIGGIGDINDSLDSIHDVLVTPPDLDEFNSVMDSVNGIYDEFDRYVFDKYPNFPPIPEAPAPDFVTRLWLIVDEVLYIGIPLQSRNLGWLTFNADDNVFRLSHFIVWFTTIFLTRAFIYAISEATKAKNNPIQGDGDD